MKRYLFGVVLTLCMLTCLAPAQAAVVSGGTEYLWCQDLDSGNVKISVDRGCTYAELPGLEAEEARTGLSYDIALYPLEDGGIRVEGRDRWSTERSYWQDYSAAQVAEYLKAALPTPKRVLCTNGQMTIAVGHVEDYENGDWSLPNNDGWARSKNHDGLFYSADGVNWTAAEQEITCSVENGWWDGSAFYAGGYLTSIDGIHWTCVEENGSDPTFSLSTDLGPYHFEYDPEGGEVYLMNLSSADTGVLLPHMGEAIRESQERLSPDHWQPGSLRAWYGPNDTVFLAVYRMVGKEALALIDYPISSLDWCLENLQVQFRNIVYKPSNNDMGLGEVTWEFRLGRYNWAESRVAYQDGSGWKWVENVPWGKKGVPLFCEGGYLWVQGAGHHLYRSPDGKTWLLSDTIRPADQESWSETYLRYWIAETKDGFIASRHGGMSRYGMFGMSGGGWYEGYSKVYFLDREFQILSSYDFGRLVDSVGWYEGAYYARVGNSDGYRDGWAGDPGVFYSGEGYTVYRSADGQKWEALPDIYTEYEEIMVPLTRLHSYNQYPLGAPIPHRFSELTVVDEATIDRWQFLLTGAGEVQLLKRNAEGWVNLPHLGEAARERGLLPGRIEAEWAGEDLVKVTLTDRNTGTFQVSITYPVESLDWVRENLGEVWGKKIQETEKAGLADLALVEVPSGETWVQMVGGMEVDLTEKLENPVFLVRRSSDSEGLYVWVQGPWSNAVELLPYTGKDFALLDLTDGRIYLSPDGLMWREAAGDWAEERNSRGHGDAVPRLAMVWTGREYIATSECYSTSRLMAQSYGEDAGIVFFLDEELNLLSSYDFAHRIESVGCLDGVCYVCVSGDPVPWNPTMMMKWQEPILYRSSDGLSWEKTDVIAVRNILESHC